METRHGFVSDIGGIGVMTGGWLPVMVAAAAINPIAIALGIAIGIIARQKWHLVLAPLGAAIVVALWSRGEGPLSFAALVMIFALLWSMIASAVKLRLST